MTEQKKSPEISIIVPVYKVEKYLNECIDSILAQTFTDFELILVDDGSPDNCPALCDAAAEKDSRVRVIHKQNGGVSTARNAGLAAAQGNWIGFVDPDDFVDKTYYEKMLRAAKQTGAELAVCNEVFMEEDGSLCDYQEQPLRTEVLSRYVDLETGEYVADDCGKCRLLRLAIAETCQFLPRKRPST